MNSEDKDSLGNNTQVVDLATFRKKKDTAEEFTRGGRKPLYVSHLTGKVTGAPGSKRNEAPDFGDRLQRIRASLDKINRLMSELKNLSADGEGREVQNPPSSSKTT